MDYDYLLPPKRPVSPLPVIVHEEEVTATTNADSSDLGQHDNQLELPPPVLLPSNYNDDIKTKLDKVDSQVSVLLFEVLMHFHCPFTNFFKG